MCDFTPILGILMLLLVMISCSEEARNTLTVEERKVVNEMFKDKLDSINKAMIKECDERKIALFDRIVDSLKVTRLEEIKLITNSRNK